MKVSRISSTYVLRKNANVTYLTTQMAKKMTTVTIYHKRDIICTRNSSHFRDFHSNVWILPIFGISQFKTFDDFNDFKNCHYYCSFNNYLYLRELCNFRRVHDFRNLSQ